MGASGGCARRTVVCKGSDYQVAKCQQWAFSPSPSNLTTDAAAVTCTRCLKAIESAKKDAEKRARQAARDAADGL